MTVHYNEFLEPDYELTELETQELEETGYTYDDAMGMGMMKIGEEYVLLERTTNYKGVKFNYGRR